MKSGLELTLPIWDNLSEIKEKYGTVDSKITDLILLTGGLATPYAPLGNGYYHIKQSTYQGGWTTLIYKRIDNFPFDPFKLHIYAGSGELGDIRPLINASYFFDDIIANKKEVDDGKYEVELGEYPQVAVSIALQNELNDALDNDDLKATMNYYTINKHPANENPDVFIKFEPDVRQEYEYHGKKYIYVNVHRVYKENYLLSNNQYMYNSPKNRAWLEVLPITWLIDEKNRALLSKKCLLSGIFYSLAYTDVKYEDSDMKKYLDDYMLHDIFQSTKYAETTYLNTTSLNNNKPPETFQPNTAQIESVLEEAKIKMKKILNH